MIRRLLDLIYPRFCAGCGKKVRLKSGHICWDCFSTFNIISSPVCELCGDPADGMIEHEYRCGWCIDHPPSFDSARSAVRYRGLLKELLHSYKYSGHIHLSADFGELLHECVKAGFRVHDYDAVLSVPLDSAKKMKRGFNQSELLAEVLAKAAGLRAVGDCLRRVRTVRPQVELNARQRRSNVKGAFEVVNTDWVEGRRFILVDDVMTTGATVNEVSRVLKEAGAAGVSVATVARG